MTDQPKTSTAKPAPEEMTLAVLLGGWSAERAVSLVTGKAYADAAREIGYKIVEIDPGPEPRIPGLAQELWEAAPDVVLNGLHGEWGEDGCVQGLLEVLRLPYTHSGVLASALAMDKERAKNTFRAAGIPVAESKVIQRRAMSRGGIDAFMAPPYVIKPVNQGSSVGVFVVRPGDNRLPQTLTGSQWDLGDVVMLERFVPGRELTVGVMGDRPLGVTEILSKSDFYDYDAKYAPGGSDHVVPADIPDAVAQAAKTHALAAHRALGCRGVTRADFRYDEAAGDDGLILLEVNTQPGMTPTSLVPEQAEVLGIGFGDLVRWMVEDASCRR